MKYRNLGRTGVKVSPLCLGTMMFGARTDAEDAYTIIDTALEAGLNFIDTADVYSRGASEHIVGEAMKRNGLRERIVLATKAHGSMSDEDPNMEGNSRRHIIEACEASLRRLQTDYIDLYQIHRPSASIPIDETLRALDDLIRAGKIRYIGCSTFSAWQVVESLWVAKELGLNRFVCEQPPYHPLDRRAEKELFPMAQTFGMGVIPWSPLAGGFFTEKYRDPKALPEQTRMQPNPEDERMRLTFSEASYAVYRIFDEIAQAKGVTMSQVALAWSLSHPAVTAPIIGPRTLAQLQDNLGALDVEITEADKARIDSVTAPERAIVPYGEADRGPHQHRV